MGVNADLPLAPYIDIEATSISMASYQFDLIENISNMFHIRPN